MEIQDKVIVIRNSQYLYQS